MSTTITLLGKLEIDVKINAPASKVYEIFQARPYLLTKISPENIQSSELLKGEWGKAGSIIYWTYTLGGKLLVVKTLVEAVDEEKNLITFTWIEGTLLEYYKKFQVTIQCVQKHMGSVIRWITEFEILRVEIPYLCNLPQFYGSISKDIEAYLRQGNQGPYEDVADDVAATSKA